jgi:hypothetical protein
MSCLNSPAGIRRIIPSGKRRLELEKWQEKPVMSFETRLLLVTKNIADRMGGAFSTGTAEKNGAGGMLF